MLGRRSCRRLGGLLLLFGILFGDASVRAQPSSLPPNSVAVKNFRQMLAAEKSKASRPKPTAEEATPISYTDAGGKHPGRVEYLAFSADGTRIASASARDLIVWDTANGKEIRVIQLPIGSEPMSIAIDDVGLRVMVGTTDGNVYLFDVGDGQKKTLLAGVAPVARVSALADGGWLAGMLDCRLVQWNSELKEVAGDWQPPETATPSEIVNSLDGRQIAVRVPGTQRWLRQLPRRLGQTSRRNVETTIADPIRSLAINGAGLSAAGTNQGQIYFWQIVPPEFVRIRAHKTSELTTVESLRFTRDDQTLFALDRFGNIEVWSADPVRRLALYRTGVEADVVDISPNGDWIAHGTDDGRVRFARLPAPTHDGVEEQKYLTKIRGLLREERFPDLEQLALSHRKETLPFPWGVLPVRQFYAELGRPNMGDNPVAERRMHLERLEKWVRQRPQSATARLALSQFHLSAALQARGDGFLSTIAARPARLASESFELANRELVEAEKLDPKDPDLYYQQIEIALRRGLPQDEVQAIVGRLMKIHPTYYPAHQAVADYLRRGERGLAAKYAAQLAERIGGVEGDKLYAWIAHHLLPHYPPGEFLEASEMDGARIRKGTIGILRDYKRLKPERRITRFLNESAFFAAMQLDQEGAKTMFGYLARVGDPVDSDLWVSDERFDLWRAWANSKKPPELTQTMLAHWRGVHFARFDGDGGIVTMGLASRYGLRMWDADGKPRGPVRELSGTLGAAWSTAAQRAAVIQTATVGDSIVLLAPDAEIAPRTLLFRGDRLTALAFSRDGERLAAGGSAQRVRIWDVAAGESRVALDVGFPVELLRFSPDGQSVAVAGQGGATVWSLTQTPPRRMMSLRPLKPLSDIEFSPDGQQLAVLFAGQLQIFPGTSEEPSKTIPLGGARLAWRGDGLRLAIAGNDLAIHLFEMPGGNEIATFAYHQADLTSLDFDANGQRLLAGSEDGLLTVWETK